MAEPVPKRAPSLAIGGAAWICSMAAGFFVK
jgi:hypothetical protein